MKIVILIMLACTSLMAKPLSDTLREIQFENNAKCFKTKERVVVCLINTCTKNYDYLCVANSGEFDLRLRVKVFKQNNELIEDVTKVIYLNK